MIQTTEIVLANPSPNSSIFYFKGDYSSFLSSEASEIYYWIFPIPDSIPVAITTPIADPISTKVPEKIMDLF
jgi:hypothetical protein